MKFCDVPKFNVRTSVWLRVRTFLSAENTIKLNMHVYFPEFNENRLFNFLDSARGGGDLYFFLTNPTIYLIYFLKVLVLSGKHTDTVALYYTGVRRLMQKRVHPCSAG